MKFKKIENSYISENTYVIYEADTALIVDPGSNFEQIDQVLIDNEIKNINIYLTHGHVDHIKSVNDFVSKYNCPVYVYEDEIQLLESPTMNMSSKMGGDIVVKNAIGIKDTIDISGWDLKVYHVPGHTSGHSMLYVKKINALFTGDFIFLNEIGRCDLPTSSLDKMYESLDTLVNFDPKIEIYPGHGQATSIGYELKNNKYINRNRL